MQVPVSLEVSDANKLLDVADKQVVLDSISTSLGITSQDVE